MHDRIPRAPTTTGGRPRHFVVRCAKAEGDGKGKLHLFARENRRFIDGVRRQLRDRGPLAASELEGGTGKKGPWWGMERAAKAEGERSRAKEEKKAAARKAAPKAAAKKAAPKAAAKKAAPKAAAKKAAPKKKGK